MYGFKVGDKVRYRTNCPPHESCTDLGTLRDYCNVAGVVTRSFDPTIVTYAVDVKFDGFVATVPCHPLELVPDVQEEELLGTLWE